MDDDWGVALWRNGNQHVWWKYVEVSLDFALKLVMFSKLWLFTSSDNTSSSCSEYFTWNCHKTKETENWRAIKITIRVICVPLRLGKGWKSHACKSRLMDRSGIDALQVIRPDQHEGTIPYSFGEISTDMTPQHSSLGPNLRSEPHSVQCPWALVGQRREKTKIFVLGPFWKKKTTILTAW